MHDSRRLISPPLKAPALAFGHSGILQLLSPTSRVRWQAPVRTQGGQDGEAVTAAIESLKQVVAASEATRNFV